MSEHPVIDQAVLLGPGSIVVLDADWDEDGVNQTVDYLSEYLDTRGVPMVDRPALLLSPGGKVAALTPGEARKALLDLALVRPPRYAHEVGYEEPPDGDLPQAIGLINSYYDHHDPDALVCNCRLDAAHAALKILLAERAGLPIPWDLVELAPALTDPQ